MWIPSVVNHGAAGEGGGGSQKASVLLVLVCISLIWLIIQTLYYNKMHLEALQGLFLSETNVYLDPTCYFGSHLGFGINMTLKHNFNTRNGFVILKLVGLEVLHKFLCYIGQNLGIPQIQDGQWMPYWIAKKPTQRMIENHRFGTLGTFKQLSWENQLSRIFFPFQSLMLLD